MDLEIIILSEVKRKTNMISFICGILKKKDANELIYTTERDSKTLKTNLWLPREKGREEV